MKTRSLAELQAIDEFAKRLRELRRSRPDPLKPGRKSAYMPVSTAAQLAGLSDSYWGRLEAGKCDPTLTSLLRIQGAFELDSLDALLGIAASLELAQQLTL